MREIRTSGSMSGDWETEPRRGVRHRLRAKAAGNSYPHPPTATAPVVDSTIVPSPLETVMPHMYTPHSAPP